MRDFSSLWRMSVQIGIAIIPPLHTTWMELRFMKNYLFFSIFVLLACKSMAGCLEIGKVHTGGISTESQLVINRCNVPISFTYCIDSPGGGPFSCRAQKFGSDDVGPGQKVAISVMRNSEGSFTTYWSECKGSSDNKTPMSTHGYFDGHRVTSKCS